MAKNHQRTEATLELSGTAVMYRNFKKTILYVAEAVSLSSKAGDLSHVINFVKVLSQKNFSVNLIIRGKDSCEELNIRNLSLFTLPDWNFFHSLFTYLIAFTVTGIKALINRPFFIYQRDSGINVGLIIAKILRVPVVLEVDGDILQEIRSFKELMKCSLKFAYSNADVIIIPSPGQLSIFKKIGVLPKKVAVVPNGVDPNRFRPLNKDYRRKILHFKNDSFYFGFVGNLELWQGLELAIYAFYELLRETKKFDLRLVIVGEGSLRKKLEKMTHNLSLENNIIFVGGIPHKKVPFLINAFDVCIAPFTSWRNRRIGVSPLKLFEYLSCGKPVIASSVPGTEIIKELDAGILVEPDNIEALKEAYKEAIKKLPYWEKRAHILHKEIATNHSWDSRVDTILRIIQQIIHRKHKFSD